MGGEDGLRWGSESEGESGRGGGLKVWVGGGEIHNMSAIELWRIIAISDMSSDNT